MELADKVGCELIVRKAARFAVSAARTKREKTCEDVRTHGRETDGHSRGAKMGRASAVRLVRTSRDGNQHEECTDQLVDGGSARAWMIKAAPEHAAKVLANRAAQKRASSRIALEVVVDDSRHQDHEKHADEEIVREGANEGEHLTHE